MQKPPFCTPKTILLHAKNHTFVLRTRNIHRMNTLRTLRKISTFNYEIPNEHSRKHPTYTPPGVGADSSCPYPYIAKYVFSHYQIRIFVSSQTDVHILKYVYSNHHTRISVPHFVGVYGYEGAINRPLQLLMGCNNVANTHKNTQRTPRKA